MPRKDLDWLMHCYVCGCDEMHACETEEGPCGWADDHLCTACDDAGEQLVIELADLAAWLETQQARAWQRVEAIREELGIPYTQVAVQIPGLSVRRLKAILRPGSEPGPPPSWQTLKQIAQAIQQIKADFATDGAA